MKQNKFGQCVYDQSEIIEALRVNPRIDLRGVLCDNAEQYNLSVLDTYSDLDSLSQDQPSDQTPEQFHHSQQSVWLMPTEYAQLDIAKYLLDLCNNDEELQRIGEELMLFQQYDLFGLLQYLKYLTDTLAQHDVLLGVGRGSSVASFALYKLGVHRVDSLYYDLDIREFLHE